ncbi:MAG: hypothetical protein JSU81_02610 [Candidatus Coatesbacteria bacterium]|nr:MAG: hypothetical protein JSU81_02610 [Candidatus Coatesbacteria bacterium]
MTNSTLPRAGLIGAAAFCMATTAALAGFGDVVSSFAVKGECLPAALAYNGAYVVSSDPGSFSDDHWKVWSEEGSILASFLPPRGLEIHDGAAFDGTNYWGSSYIQNTVYSMNTTGSILTSFPRTRTYGLTWDGQYLWTSDAGGNNELCRHTTAGSVVSSFPVPQPFALACDLGWDGAYLWAPDSRGYVYRLTTTGTIVASFDPPGMRTSGCTFDGTYLRLSCFPGSGPWHIYTIDVGPLPAVAPASLGRVKALFR